MKMKIKIPVILFLSMFLAAFSAGCSDWTEQESLGIEYPSVEDTDSPAYQEYLANLRKYKQTYHPLMIGLFDNSAKTFRSRAERIKAVPDKVDIISLMYPDNLADLELQDIASVRKDKGTKVIYTIALADFQKYIEDTNFDIENENMAGLGDPSYIPKPLMNPTVEVTGYMDTHLALLDKYGYDGFILYYAGKATHFMNDNEIAEMQAMQDLIFGKAVQTMKAHPGKTYILEGKPQNVLDRSILLNFDYLLIRTQYLNSIYETTAITGELALSSDIPTNNILVGACASYTDKDGNEWGMIYGKEGSKQNAIVETAYWVTEADTFTKAGMAVYMVNRDYFNPDLDYKHVREAIDIMNPSPKK